MVSSSLTSPGSQQTLLSTLGAPSTPRSLLPPKIPVAIREGDFPPVRRGRELDLMDSALHTQSCLPFSSFCGIIGSLSGGQQININQFDFPTSLELLCAWSRSQGLVLDGNSWVEMGAEASLAGAENKDPGWWQCGCVLSV